MITDDLLVYADGSCLGNPGPGGWAVIIVIPDQEPIAVTGGHEKTTNNAMELVAAIEALTMIPPELSGVLRTDSQYVVNGMNEWRIGWKKRRWRKSDGKPVMNVDLWRRLDELASERPQFRFEWVRGHAGDSLNELCDRMARDEAEQRRSKK